MLRCYVFIEQNLLYYNDMVSVRRYMLIVLHLFDEDYNLLFGIDMLNPL